MADSIRSQNENQMAALLQKPPSMLTRIAAAMSVVLLISLILMRAFGGQLDGGLLNIATLILGFFAWLSLVLALARTNTPGWIWMSLLVIPILSIVVLMSMYRIVRVNGELIPQLESRWKNKAALPTESTAETVNAIPPSELVPRPTDSPKFLGPGSDGRWNDVQLQTDWSTQAPEIVWKQPIGNGWSSFAIQGNVAVTLEQRADEQWMSAYDVTTGKMYWHVAVPGSHFNPLGGAGPRATPTIDGSNVYAQMANGVVVCAELATGKTLWQVDLLSMAGWSKSESESAISWGRSGSPLLVDGKVIVPLGGPSGDARSLIALDKADGHTLWKVGSDQISYSSPSLHRLLGTDVVVMVNEKTVTAHDLQDGSILWTTEWDSQSNGAASCSQTIFIDDDNLLLTKGYSQGAKLLQLSKDDAGKWKVEEIWKKSSILKTKFTSAVLKGDYVYGLSDGTLECVRVIDGLRAWKNGRYQHGQVLLVGDTLLIVSEAGELVLVAADPGKFRQLAKMEVLSGVTWNVPALSGNRLIMRNADEMACLRLPLRSTP